MCDAFIDALERRVLFASAELVRDIKPGPGSPSTWQDFVAHGSMLYFSVDDGSIGRELWVSNGTAGSTSPVELNPGTGGSDPTAVAEAGGALWFTATTNGNNASANRVLWRLARPVNSRPATRFWREQLRLSVKTYLANSGGGVDAAGQAPSTELGYIDPTIAGLAVINP